MTEAFGIAGSNPAALPFLSRLQASGMDVAGLSPNLSVGANALDTLDQLRVLLLVPRDIMDSEELLFENQGFARKAPGLEIIILAATLSPRYVRALRARISPRIALIDAPFLGNARAVEQSPPSFLLGGDAAAIDRVRPIFEILGHSHVVMGGFGTAMAAKALQDCLSAASSAMTRSALEWADAQGIDETRVVNLLATTFYQRMPCDILDPASFVTNALPGDDAGAVLVRNVETALDAALAGVHLNPPRNYVKVFATVRSRLLH